MAANNFSSEIESLVKNFGLQPHPEGGFYKETYRCQESISLSLQSDDVRNISTAIYYLLKANSFSAFHRFNSDEIWHYYRGSSLNIYIIDRHGKLDIRRLGDPIEDKMAEPQVVVPANSWFAASLDSQDFTQYTFLGCTVAPGFDFRDFEIGKQADLINQFPQLVEVIKKYSHM